MFVIWVVHTFILLESFRAKAAHLSKKHEFSLKYFNGTCSNTDKNMCVLCIFKQQGMTGDY